MVWEILLAVFCTIGLAACIRFAVGRMVYPIRGALIILPARGDGRTLEHQLKGLWALSSEGRLEDERIFLADFDLNDEGLANAERLCRRYPGVCFCVMTQEQDSI